ncbi:substrate-binding periplasmic protein [Maridesulfovibrio sp.]|uniref:substrate-binding periplasmic protein n=1 Tax=Maridesulfovibrio sp. TaxID=2795000 RepID=UPI003BA93367
MRKKILIFTLVLLIAMTGSAAAHSLRNTIFITEELPPYNYTENGKLTGASVQILDAALDAVGIEQPANTIRVYPWARGFKTTLKIPNTCLFSTVRTDVREKNFKWVGPIADVNLIFISNKNGFKIDNLEEIKKYSVTTIREGIGHQILKREGFSDKHIDLSADISTMVEKIKRNRVDFLLESDNVIYQVLENKKINSSTFNKYYTLNFGQLYFAFNKETDDSVVSRLQEGLNIIRKNGKLDKILSKLPARSN